MKFSEVKKVRIPRGNVLAIKSDGDVLWDNIRYRYVSLGDSISAGHTINEDWAKDYGEGSQYGVNGNTSTVIVPNCYVDLIRRDLRDKYGVVSAKSFSRSGDTVADLIEKLSHDVVRNNLRKANLVTVCIGANDVLEPAMSHLDDYINTGDLTTLEAIVENNLTVLSTDSNANSYVSLFNKLMEINPNAQYVFTTIYNPYKYLWIEDGHYGFFQPLLATIPSIEIFGFDIDSLIKDTLLGTPIVQLLFNRVNGLGDWAEKYVTKLNNVLRSKIGTYSNFSLADSKALFDTYPDRTIAADKHYNDLVSVEFTKDFDVYQVDWGALWNGSDAGTFWWNLARKYVSLSGLDINGFASELVEQIIDKVITPDVDPHPETYGQYALKRAFSDVLGWESLKRYNITFNANGGSGAMTAQEVVTLENLTAYVNINVNGFIPPSEGYYFNGWNTKDDGSGTTYTDGQFVGINSDITLYAQWSNIYTVTFRHTKESNYHGSDETGPQECYALYIDGVEQSDLSKFSNPARTYKLLYGTSIGVIAQTKSGDGRSYVTVNGVKVAENSSDSRWEFALTSDTDINFEWNYWLEGITPQSYWNCYITT